jgi:hypothetical protein
MLEHSPSLLLRLPPHRPSAATKATYQDKISALQWEIDWARIRARALHSRAVTALRHQAILKYVPACAPRRYHTKLKPVRAEMRRALDRLLKE